MPTPIGVLPDITAEEAAALDIIPLDTAREQYRVAQLAHRLESADYITHDVKTALAHLTEAARLTQSLEVIYDEVSMRRIRANVMNAINTMKDSA